MKKFSRVISFVVLSAFLINSTIADLAFSMSSGDKLAAASRFGDLLGPQGQDMARIRFILAGHIAGAKDGDSVNLPRLIDAVSSYRDSSEKDKAPVEFEPLQVFGHEMQALPSNLMYVMCRVRHKFLGLHTYYAVFPRAWEGEGFPMEVYTEKEWAEDKIYEFLTDNYIHRRIDYKTSASAAIERDVVHQGFDSVLQWAHDRSNGNFTRSLDSVGIDYYGVVSYIMNRMRGFGISVKLPENPNILPIEGRNASVVIMESAVKERLIRNMVSLRAADGSTEDIIPGAHLSNNYLNILLTPQEIRTLSKGGKAAERIKHEITCRIVHEIGVSFGLPIIFFDNLRPVNIFDLLWNSQGDWDAVRRELNSHGIDPLVAGLRPDNIYQIQDLDTNIDTRDIASGGVSATPPEGVSKVGLEEALRDAALLSPLARKFIKIISVTTPDAGPKSAIASVELASKSSYSAFRLYYYWWYWRMVFDFDNIYVESERGFLDNRFADTLMELKKAGFINIASENIVNSDSSITATDKLRLIAAAFPVVINDQKAIDVNGSLRAKSGVVTYPNGDLEAKLPPPSSGDAAVFETTRQIADTVTRALNEFMMSSSRTIREEARSVINRNHEAAYFLGMAVMDGIGRSLNASKPALGPNAFQAYERFIRELRSRGVVAGDRRSSELGKLLGELARRVKNTKPGKNPQAALNVIVFDKALQAEPFTVTDYLASYQEAAVVFGYEALSEKRPDDTARRDLKGLMAAGYLKASKKRGEYELTAKGKSKVAELAPQLDPVINKDIMSFIPREIIDALDNYKEKKLVVGVPTEIKRYAERVGLTPAGVKALVSLGITVIVQRGAGREHFNDGEYIAAGARMANTASEVWEQSDIIKKVKEPLNSAELGINELDLMRPGQIVYTYLHLASPDCRDLTYSMFQKGVTGIAYETIVVVDENGKKRTPVLEPMSIIAGHLGGYFGVIYSLWSETVKLSGEDVVRLTKAGKGMMARVKSDYTHAQGFRDVAKGKKAVVMGGGISGLAAARTLLKCGVQVTITDADPDKVKELKRILGIYGKKVEVMLVSRDINSPSPDLLKRYQEADMLYGCILKRGAPAPQISPELMAKISKPELGGKKKSAVINIAIDQGGNFPESHSTYYDNPVYFDSLGNMMFGVANMPDFVGGIASVDLERTNVADTAALSMGFAKAMELSPRLKGGVNIYDKHLFIDDLHDTYGDIPIASFAQIIPSAGKETLADQNGAVSRQGGAGEMAPGFEMAATVNDERLAIGSIATFEEVFKGARRKNEKEAIYRQIWMRLSSVSWL